MTASGNVTVALGDPNAHRHDWRSTGQNEDGSHSLECEGCPATGRGFGDFSDEARQLRRDGQPPSEWKVNGPTQNGVHPIVDQYGNESTCDCPTPQQEDSGAWIAPQHPEAAPDHPALQNGGQQ